MLVHFWGLGRAGLWWMSIITLSS